MDELVEELLRVVFEIAIEGIDAGIKSRKKDIDYSHLEVKDQELIAIIAILIAMSYDNDGKVTRQEKKLIQQFITNPTVSVSRQTKKQIKKLKRRKLKPNDLEITLNKLSIKRETVYHLFSKIESHIYHLTNERDQYIQFLRQMKAKYSDKR